MLNNQDFALMRAKSLGGSDVGAVLGLSKYRSTVDVWMEKTGKEVAARDSLPLRFGQFAESFVASEYALATGLALATHDAAVVHPEYSYMHGHIDRFVLSGDLPLICSDGQINASRILECKTANPFAQSVWGEAGSDQVPLPYLVQCIWYMAITGIEQADLAVLMGNADFRIYEIHRDLELEEMVIDRARVFWEEHVLKDIPPAAQRESDLKILFPRSTPKAVEAKKETCELIAKMKDIQAKVESYEQEISQIKQQVMAEMQDAEVLTYGGQVLATWKTPKPSTRLDTKKLTEEHPELIAPYQIQVPNSRRFVVKD